MKSRGKLGKLKKNKIVLPGARQQNRRSAQNQRENNDKEALRYRLEQSSSQKKCQHKGGRESLRYVHSEGRRK